jgi:hypothetical protein
LRLFVSLLLMPLCRNEAPFEGLRGTLRYVKSASDVDALIAAAPSYSLAVVMPQSLFLK